MTLLENSGNVLTMAFCWSLERRDGAGLALTSHDQQLVIEGTLHQPAPGISPAAVSRSAGLQSEAGEVSGALTSDAFTEADLTAGRWKGARTRLAAVSWDSVNNAPMTLLDGELGEIATKEREFTADLIGPSAELGAPICPATSPECRASFGDRRCGVDLAGRVRKARIVAVQGTTLTVDQSVDPAFIAGRLRFLSGANCGLTIYVLAVDGPVIHLREPPRCLVAEGDLVSLREGCDKRLETCRERFGNAENFRGEPHLPGNDLLTRYSGG